MLDCADDDVGADPTAGTGESEYAELNCWVPDDVNVTSSGRAPRAAATEARARSSSNRARRPSV